MTIRDALPADEAAFLAMWRDFVATAPDEPGNPAIGALNWARVMDGGNPMACLIATDGAGTVQGFLLHLAFPFSWSRGDACYMLDLYVCDAARGQGLAQAMIGHLRALGVARGWFKIFWMTTPQNAAAQRLYDKLALRRDYIRYDLPVSPP